MHFRVKGDPPANVGDARDSGSVPGLGKSPGGGHGSPLQCCCLENPHGQRSLAGYSPWALKELDMTEATWHTSNKTKVVWSVILQFGPLYTRAVFCSERRWTSDKFRTIVVDTGDTTMRSIWGMLSPNSETLKNSLLMMDEWSQFISMFHVGSLVKGTLW